MNESTPNEKKQGLIHSISDRHFQANEIIRNNIETAVWDIIEINQQMLPRLFGGNYSSCVWLLSAEIRQTRISLIGLTLFQSVSTRELVCVWY